VLRPRPLPLPLPRPSRPCFGNRPAPIHRRAGTAPLTLRRRPRHAPAYPAPPATACSRVLLLARDLRPRPSADLTYLLADIFLLR
jgi:hypothetical protein